MKTLSAEKVKKLPVSTDVWIVKEDTGEKGMMWIVRSGRKKILKGIYTKMEIKDRPGIHYEVKTKK